MEIEIIEPTTFKYVCHKCNYMCDRLFNWNKHLATSKHQTDKNVESSISSIFCPTCGKKYATSSGLWKHRKICVSQDKELLLALIKQNNELLEIVKHCIP